MTYPEDEAAIDEMETAITNTVNELAPVVPPAPPENVQPFPTRHPTVALAQQWDQYQRVERELRDRVRRERIEILAEHDRLVTATDADFTRRRDDINSQIDRQHAQAQRTLTDQRDAKLRELDLLTERMGK